jgi:hypothetical protein
MTEHFMTCTIVTRFRGAVPVEVATWCGECSDGTESSRWILGKGDSLPECLADLTTNFNAHVEAS